MKPDRKTEPTKEQQAAIDAYRVEHGRSWKRALAADWWTGRDAQRANGHLLRQVRNQLGPQWLERQ